MVSDIIGLWDAKELVVEPQHCIVTKIGMPQHATDVSLPTTVARYTLCSCLLLRRCEAFLPSCLPLVGGGHDDGAMTGAS